MLFVGLDSDSTLDSALEATTVALRLSRLPVGRDDSPGSGVSVNSIT